MKVAAFFKKNNNSVIFERNQKQREKKILTIQLNKIQLFTQKSDFNIR